MKLSIKGKYIYLLIVAVITLLGIILIPTYAKFVAGYVTEDDIVGINLDFNLSISSVDQYEEIVIPAGQMVRFKANIANDTSSNIYYGIWYKMYNPSTMPEGNAIQIGKLKDTENGTTGSISSYGTIEVGLGIINSTNSEVRIYIGVESSSTGVGDIEYLNGKKLITSEVDSVSDIYVSSIIIDGAKSSSLPTSGNYTMTYDCSRGSNLSWNTYTKSITYEIGAKARDICTLEFISSTNYPLLNTMEVGSYVAYSGNGGSVGSTSVTCKNNGELSNEVEYEATESSNSCSGESARADLDNSGYTNGYCNASVMKYYDSGWRIAYIADGKVKLVSAGAPECFGGFITEVTADNFVKSLNANALKYCNSEFVDGNCTCTSSSTGMCDTASTDAWSINDTDFYYMTKNASGFGKRLTLNSSSLGDSGGALGSILYCYNGTDAITYNSYVECGYNYDLLDIGGFYWLGKANGTFISWDPTIRTVSDFNTYDVTLGLRPIINLSSTVKVTGGSGTKDDPYTITNS